MCANVPLQNLLPTLHTVKYMKPTKRYTFKPVFGNLFKLGNHLLN